MNPFASAAGWLVLGILASAFLRPRMSTLLAVIPLAGAGLTLLVAASSTAGVPLGGLAGIAGLDRGGKGVLVAASISMTG